MFFFQRLCCSLGLISSWQELELAEGFDAQACLVHSNLVSCSVVSCIFVVLFFVFCSFDCTLDVCLVVALYIKRGESLFR